MRKGLKLLMLALVSILIISACSSNNEGNGPDQGNAIEENDEGHHGQPIETEDPDDSTSPDDGLLDEEPGEGDGGLLDEEPGEGLGDEEGNGEDGSSGLEDSEQGPMTEVEEMAQALLEQVENRATMPLEDDMIQDWYHLDPELLADYSIHLPMFNISTNEFAILKANDESDIPVIEEALAERALDVQKSFENYLPDQYENAKNYKVVVNGSYILFVIDEPDVVDAFIQLFEDYIAEHLQ